MGVKLKEILVQKKVNFSDINGKVVAVDAPNLIMSLFCFAYKGQRYSMTRFMTDRTGRAISHLYGLLFRVIFYYSKSILPIFCFDGRVHELKRAITKDQLNDYLTTKKWYRNALERNDYATARRIASSREFTWPHAIEESKKLLSMMGVPYILAPASAESQCAHMVKQEIADYAISQDFDTMVFGCPRTLQNLNKSQKRKVRGKWIYKKVVPRVLDLQYNLDNLDIDIFHLVEIAILIGTDYFDGIEGIGPKTALSLVRTYGQMEHIMKAESDKHDFSELTTDLLKKIRKIFLFPEVLEILPDMRWDRPNKEAILELACSDHHLNQERVENNVNKLISSYEMCRKTFSSCHPKSLKNMNLDSFL
ncbi:MAG: hypothetical protein GF383_01755 [Candidatus Lokiarchaeota archaeon]|nr:hypothetical protein [Candidatus Lokiarchaeota archaeon]MBD3338035.1 hypothetical protein [Candidatus Lokiarchaeota archaeon]